jgi:hypothetical protein
MGIKRYDRRQDMNKNPDPLLSQRPGKIFIRGHQDIGLEFLLVQTGHQMKKALLSTPSEVAECGNIQDAFRI